MPEYIEKFFVEAYRSFGGTISPAKGQKCVWSLAHVPADLRKLPDSLERRFGKVGTKYPKLTFDKRPIGRLLRPGVRWPRPPALRGRGGADPA